MELLKLSKFKLQLQSMIGEVRDLRVRRKRFMHLWIVQFSLHNFSQLLPLNYRRFCRKGSDQSQIRLILRIRFFNQLLTYIALVFVAFLSRDHGVSRLVLRYRNRSKRRRNTAGKCRSYKLSQLILEKQRRHSRGRSGRF